MIYHHLKVKRCRALPDSARSIIMRSVAGTIVSSEFTSVGDGYTTKMGANTYTLIGLWYNKTKII